MTTLLDNSALALTPRFLYEQARAFGRQCLPVRVLCEDGTRFTLRNDCLCYAKRGAVLDVSILQPDVFNGYYMTVYDLFNRSRDKGLVDAPLRICDAMAVSYFPIVRSVRHLKNEIIIDLTDLDMVEYDDLQAEDMVVDWNL